jgi:hypothetical protein
MKRGAKYPGLELCGGEKSLSENIFHFSIKTCLITCKSIINSNVFPAISGYLHTIELINFSAGEHLQLISHRRLYIIPP